MLLKILSPLLVIIGVAGYLIPNESSFLCTDQYYNLLHINLGLLGFIVMLSSSQLLVRLFTISMGLIFVYQATASLLHIFPAIIFKYTIVDDIINTDIGLILLFVGIMANSGIREKKNVTV